MKRSLAVIGVTGFAICSHFYGISSTLWIVLRVYLCIHLVQWLHVSIDNGYRRRERLGALFVAATLAWLVATLQVLPSFWSLLVAGILLMLAFVFRDPDCRTFEFRQTKRKWRDRLMWCGGVAIACIPVERRDELVDNYRRRYRQNLDRGFTVVQAKIGAAVVVAQMLIGISVGKILSLLLRQR